MRRYTLPLADTVVVHAPGRLIDELDVVRCVVCGLPSVTRTGVNTATEAVGALAHHVAFAPDGTPTEWVCVLPLA